MRDGDEVLDGIVLKFLEKPRRKGVGGRAAQQDRIAVGYRTRHGGRADGPAGARLVLHDDRLAEFPAQLVGKQPAGDIDYASNGSGTYPHLSVELLKQVIHVQPVHVPYKGGGQAITALIANEVQFSQNHIPVVLPYVKSGRLRVLATTGASRSSTYPNVPTLKEAGYDVVASAWFGLFAPAGTPRAIVERLYAATAAAAKVPGLREKLNAQGDEIVVEGPDKFLAYQLAELEKWKTVIGQAKLKLQ